MTPRALNLIAGAVIIGGFTWGFLNYWHTAVAVILVMILISLGGLHQRLWFLPKGPQQEPVPDDR